RQVIAGHAGNVGYVIQRDLAGEMAFDEPQRFPDGVHGASRLDTLNMPDSVNGHLIEIARDACQLSSPWPIDLFRTGTRLVRICHTRWTAICRLIRSRIFRELQPVSVRVCRHPDGG